ncbi:MAG TPA: glycoside hydrolase family 3 N-terminal domain-containing protein [Candidatus Dormibacteraeota bacterium]|jgi:beta-N-acetylhexosaminidase|nr:glycoside hydrolase family 3 N-terminal domain-containing protein [Candidatus Dormibacteraeota bacterium]
MATTRTTLTSRKIGQLLIVGFDGVEMTPNLSSLLKHLQPAGVILFARNIVTVAQTWRLLRDCQKCVSTPLFTCVDLEGGLVDRFRDVLGPTPSAADVFATGDRKLFRKHGQIIGQNCRALGFNVDFAPALDLAFEASRSVMASRVVSANPRETVAYARDFLAGLRSADVLGCGKHFPGLGEGKLDSHHELTAIKKSLTKLWAEDLLPYRTLRTQLPLVMISHAAYPPVTPVRTPASISKKWITDILRRRIGYRNLIVSDDLEMGAVLSATSVRQAAVEFVRGGGDLCLICHRTDYIAQAYDELVKMTEGDSKFAERVDESVRRVLSFKKKCAKALRRRPRPSSTTVEKLTRKLWEFGEEVRLAALDRREKDGKKMYSARTSPPPRRLPRR